MNEASAKAVLFEVVDVLDGYGLEFSLFYGTLLGAVREQRFIPTDDDLDLACKAEDFQPLAPAVCSELQRRNFWLHYVDHRHVKPWDRGVYALKFHKQGISGDLAAWFRHEDKRWQPAHIGPISIVLPWQLVEYTSPVEFYGRQFQRPRDYDRLLTMLYGAWRVPADKPAGSEPRPCYVEDYP